MGKRNLSAYADSTFRRDENKTRTAEDVRWPN